MAAALESYVTESVALLLVVAALAALVLLAARRAGLGRPLGPIELLARLPLEPRRSVYVVRVVDQLLIIGSSEAGLVKLGELPNGAFPPGEVGSDKTFAGWLENVWRGGGPGSSAASGRAATNDDHGAVR
ncbi:MAG TPA: flagellar biosynthetic protein FliO [Polyangiaceae bacterium]|nr:flagellar biosynthetic protein FliO [Polyangiaceae bacterium]